MKDVLQYLVIEKGVDIECVDEVLFFRYLSFLSAILYLGGKDALIVRM